MTATDLWPDIPFEPKPRGVRQILEEAGAGLKEKTKGLVEFRVWPEQGETADFPFRYRCDLRVDKLDYNYLLLEVLSAPTGFPVEVWTGRGARRDPVTATDEASLLTALGAVFWSAETRAVIKNLVSMATD